MTRETHEPGITALQAALDELARAATPERAAEVLAALGALGRQSVLRDGGPTLEALEERAAALAPALQQAEDALVSEAAALLEGLRVEEPASEEDSLALAAQVVEGRERLEAAVQAAAALRLSLTAELPAALERLDRVGRALVQRLLPWNAERRSRALARRPEARAAWWWALRADCDRDALVLAADGLLAPEARATLERHLAACAACREDARWLARVDRLLGGRDDAHPTAAELVAHAAGELTAGRRQALATHLAGCALCRELQTAARAGLDEAERALRGLALLEAARTRPVSLPEGPPEVPLHLVLPVATTPARVLAASPAEAAPLPADRRVLLEEPGLRVVYHRVGGEAELALFGERLAGLTLVARLDGAPLEATPDEDALLLPLGPAAALPGRTLELELAEEGRPALRCSFTFVEEAR